MKAIIGGTGVYNLGITVQEKTVTTPYGDVIVDIADFNGEEIVFLARHGKAHSTPPHLINYRANAMALKQLGVDTVFSTCAVGSMNDSYAPGDIVVINDFLDFTKTRIHTFYEGGDSKVAHVEMTDPYCSSLRKHFKIIAKANNLDIKGDAVYVCTEGPRFETAAEIRMYEAMGGDVVGMTNVPEVVLFKELGICYAAIGVITNWCTGFAGKEIVSHEIEESMSKNKEKLTKVFIEALLKLSDRENCNCENSLIIL